MHNGYLKLLGLAYRARKCVLGEEAIVQSIRKQEVKCVVLASDIGKHTRKKIINKCKTYNVPFVIADHREILSSAIGQTGRVAIGIIDQGFAEKIYSYFT